MPQPTESATDKLDRILTAIGDDHDEVMILAELDGFLAGVIVSPEMMPTSSWMHYVWSVAGDQSPEIFFDDVAQAHEAVVLIVNYYNTVARSLLTDYGPYEPYLLEDPRNGEILWSLWAAGFERALNLAPESWLQIPLSGDAEATEALAGLRSLVAINNLTSSLPKDEQESLHEKAPYLIMECVETLAFWRLGSEAVAPISQDAAFRDVGRNDPCPCGSGEKYKKCHGAG